MYTHIYTVYIPIYVYIVTHNFFFLQKPFSNDLGTTSVL